MSSWFLILFCDISLSLSGKLMSPFISGVCSVSFHSLIQELGGPFKSKSYVCTSAKCFCVIALIISFLELYLPSFSRTPIVGCWSSRTNLLIILSFFFLFFLSPFLFQLYFLEDLCVFIVPLFYQNLKIATTLFLVFRNMFLSFIPLLNECGIFSYVLKDIYIYFVFEVIPFLVFWFLLIFFPFK